MPNTLSIGHWPNPERPRERLANYGAEALSDAELLAIILRNGIRGKSAVALARELLNSFGGLRGIFNAEISCITQQPGVGLAKSSQIKAVLELARRYLRESVENGPAFANNQDVQNFIAASLSRHQQEVFACLLLDNQHKLLQFERLFHGTINSANVYPRELIKRALQYNAAAVIIAHNHPSGNPMPSVADQEITQLIQQSLQLVDITLLDHFIVAGNQIFSFKTHGYL